MVHHEAFYLLASVSEYKQIEAALRQSFCMSRNSPVSRSSSPLPSTPLSTSWCVGPLQCCVSKMRAWRVMSQEQCLCLWGATVLLTGARAGAVQPVPITGALPASPWTSLVQGRCSVAPAAQARLENKSTRTSVIDRVFSSMQDGVFPTSFGFISHFRLAKSP